jgi:2-oxoglutarate ferredoxin oxidoreductase subunit gamma
VSRLAEARAGPCGGLVVTEADVVTVTPPAPDGKHVVVPATRLPEEIGRRIVLSIITVGFFGAVSRLMLVEALEDAVKEPVPPGTLDLNLRAFSKGYDAGLGPFAKAQAPA